MPLLPEGLSGARSLNRRYDKEGGSSHPLFFLEISQNSYSYIACLGFEANPYIGNWSVTIDLGDERVDDLRYRRPEALIIVVFAGDRLLARQWVLY